MTSVLAFLHAKCQLSWRFAYDVHNQSVKVASLVFSRVENVLVAVQRGLTRELINAKQVGFKEIKR